jgi:hypothetical protein
MSPKKKPFGKGKRKLSTINNPPIPFGKERKKGRKSNPTSPNEQLLWKNKCPKPYPLKQ